MRTIYKYPLSLDVTQIIEAPLPARVLCVKNQNGTLCAWLEVDTAYSGHGFYPREREFMILATGQEMPSEHVMKDYHYIETVQVDHLVWHVYCKNYKEEL
jgi:hypothetical protein